MNQITTFAFGASATVGAPTMSSREIADLVGSRHDKVKQSIERLADRGTIVQPPMGDEPETDAMGRVRTTRVYRIGKRDSYVIVAQLSPEFTARLVDRWQALEEGAGTMAALQDPAALRGLLLGYSERVLALEERNTALAGENATLAPKADALDRIGATTGSMNITAAAKVLKVGPRSLGAWLLSHGWTYRRPDGDRMLAFQAKIDAGYLEHRMVRFGQPERSAFQVMVTAKGITKLAAALAERAAA